MEDQCGSLLEDSVAFSMAMDCLRFTLLLRGLLLLLMCSLDVNINLAFKHLPDFFSFFLSSDFFSFFHRNPDHSKVAAYIKYDNLAQTLPSSAVVRRHQGRLIKWD